MSRLKQAQRHRWAPISRSGAAQTCTRPGCDVKRLKATGAGLGVPFVYCIGGGPLRQLLPGCPTPATVPGGYVLWYAGTPAGRLYFTADDALYVADKQRLPDWTQLVYLEDRSVCTLAAACVALGKVAVPRKPPARRFYATMEARP